VGLDKFPRGRLTILDMHFDSRPIWWLAYPCVQILALARLEEEDIVAVVEFGELIELVELCLGV
jgi:hypothetical protein